MDAVIEIKGRQYKVKKGDVILVDLLGETKKTYKADHVLLASDGKKVSVGKPYLKDVVVQGTVLGDERAPKVGVGKFKKRKRYRRKNGHRQAFTRLKIDKVSRA